MSTNNDGEVVIDTRIDTSGVEEGIGKVTKTLNKLADNKTLTALSKLGNAVTGVSSAFNIVSKAVGKTSAAIKECTDLYKTQTKAETLLSTAAKNNPYLDGNSVKSLKNYAGELQSISTYGDEQLLPFMSQLASSGRTQSEIMDIMSASVDIAASGVMSLDEAVSNLNRTYSGNIGRLGMTIPAVKNLTEEELKNGKATQIVAEQFKGMAKATAEATGSSEQLKNAWGDFKETLGEGWQRITSPIEKFFTKILTHINDINSKTNIYEDIEKGSASAADVMKNIEEKQKELDDLLSKQNETLDNSEQRLKEWAEFWGTTIEEAPPLPPVDDFEGAYSNEGIERIAELQTEIAVLTENYNNLAAAEKEAAEAAKNAEANAAEQSANDKASKAKLAYIETVKKAQEEIALRKKLGEQITDEEAAQEMLNVRMAAYIKMIEDAGGTISGNKGFAKEEAERIAAEAARLGKADSFAGAKDVVAQWQAEEQNQLQHQKAMLDIYEDYLRKKELKTSEEVALYKQVQEAQKNVNKAIEQEQKEHIAKTLTDINSYVSEFASITESMTALIGQSNNRETESQMAELDDQYTKGILSYEEYEEKKKEIKKKAAEEQYKLDMWNWTSQLMLATANVAQGISKAIADNGMPAGAIFAALAGAAGAIQIATITANKPQRPSFATGGIVGGSSYHGDNIQGNLNSREMILNYGQQRNLFDAINRGNIGGGNVTMPVTINNNSSANVSTRFNKNGLIVVVDEIVNSSMQQGKYNGSLTAVQQNTNGKAFL